MSRTSYHVLVSGRVQGVFFRAATRDKATQLGLTGWVRNLADGRVEARVEGEPAALEQMLHWLRQGPSAAVVEDVQVEPATPENHNDFAVIQGEAG